MNRNWRETLEGELDKEFPCLARARARLIKLESMFVEATSTAEYDELKAAVEACEREIDRVARLPSEDRQIDSLRLLPIRVSNALRRRGIVTVSQLKQESETSLCRMKAIGPVAIRDLEQALRFDGIAVPWMRP